MEAYLRKVWLGKEYVLETVRLGQGAEPEMLHCGLHFMLTLFCHMHMPLQVKDGKSAVSALVRCLPC